MKRILAALAVTIAANVAMLGSARANRAGEPEALLRLTERELRLEPTSARDSSRRLQLAVSSAGYLMTPYDETGRWLTEPKLTALGFDCAAARSRLRTGGVGSCGLNRQVFAAFEFDGAAWTERIERLRTKLAAQAEPTRDWRVKTLEQEVTTGSRLVPIDASVDPAALRAAHPDRARYLILPAVVQASTDREPPKDPATPMVTGWIRTTTPSLVVPVAYAAMLSKFPSSRYTWDSAPRYTVTLAVARRYEPWIVSIDPIDSASAPH